MTAICRKPNRGFFVVPGLTVIFWLAGVIVLPAHGQSNPNADLRETTRAAVPLITHNSWSSGAQMPTAVWAPGGVGVVKGEIYVVGGVNAANTATAATQIYNPVTNAWTTGPDLPTALDNGAGAVVKNILYIFGGISGSVTNAVWAYNPRTKVWTPKAAMPTARQSIGAVVVKNIVYVIGGNSGSTRFNTVESYNPATDKWAEEEPLLVGKSEPSVGYAGTMIVAADGFTTSGDTGDNEGYNLATNTWTSFKRDPTPRNTACGAGIGLMYAAGGYPGGGPGTPALTLTESFNVKTNTWKTLAPMPQAEMFGGSALYKGKLYCIGGTRAFQDTVLKNVQIYQK